MLIWLVIAAFCTTGSSSPAAALEPNGVVVQAFTNTVKPLVATYCLRCHSTEKHKGGIDFEQFTHSGDVLRRSKPWERAIEQLSHGDMPPPDELQPTVEERQRLVAGLNAILDAVWCKAVLGIRVQSCYVV
jgi:uncharacterized membrane protein